MPYDLYDMKRLLRYTTLHIATFAVLCVAPLEGQTQPRAPFLDVPGEIRLPRGYDGDREYPVIVFLPFTGGSAEDFYRRIEGELPSDQAILLLPEGRPVREDYLPDFISFVQWYEERLLADLDRLEREHRVRSDAVVMAGFSLGGDVAWALLLRNPERFRGAVMAGTRTSYPPTSPALQALADRDVRAALIIGRDELPARYTGIAGARETLRTAGVEVRFREVSGGHTYGDVSQFAEDLVWVLADAVVSDDRPASAPPVKSKR